MLERLLKWAQMALTAAGLSQAEPPVEPVIPAQPRPVAADPAPLRAPAPAPAPAPAQVAAPPPAAAPAVKSAVPVVEVKQASFEGMEAVVAQASSLRDFLSNSALQKEYLAELEIYYGMEFNTGQNKGSYSLFIEHLRGALAVWPELDQLLWEATPSESFVITPAVRSSGRKMTPESMKLWHEYFAAEILAPLKAQAGRFQELSFDGVFEEIPRVRAALAEKFEAQKAAILASDQPKKGKAIEALRGKMLADPDFKALAADLVYRYLTSRRAYPVFAAMGLDANVILDVLTTARQHPQILLEGWGEMPEGMANQIRALLPDPKKLLARKDLFPELMQQARDGKLIPVGTTPLETYVAETAPRRFHHVWETIANQECIGGGRWRDDYAGNATPRRWLTIALAGTKRIHLRGNGKYLGFVHLVEIRHKPSGRVYAAYEAFPKVMVQDFTVIDPATGLPVSKPFYEIFLAELAPRLPKTWNGLVMGKSERAANHQGGMREMRSHSLFTNGQVLGGPGDFEAADPEWRRLLALPEETTGIWVKDYRGIIVIDALLFDAMELRSLALPVGQCAQAVEP